MTRRTTAYSAALRFLPWALLLGHAVFVGAVACFFAVYTDPSGALAGWLGASDEPARGVVGARLLRLSTVAILANALSSLAFTWVVSVPSARARGIRTAVAVALGALPLLAASIRGYQGELVPAMGGVIALAALVGFDAIRRQDAVGGRVPTVLALALAAHAVLVVGEGLVSFGARPLPRSTILVSARAYADHPWPVLCGAVATGLLVLAAFRSRRDASGFALGAASLWVLGQVASDLLARTVEVRQQWALILSDFTAIGAGLLTGVMLLLAGRKAFLEPRAGFELGWLLPLGMSIALLPFDLPSFAGSGTRLQAARLRALEADLIEASPSAEGPWQQHPSASRPSSLDRDRPGLPPVLPSRCGGMASSGPTTNRTAPRSFGLDSEAGCWARMPPRFLILGRGGAQRFVDRDRATLLAQGSDLQDARWRDRVVIFARTEATRGDLRGLTRELPADAAVYLARVRPGRPDEAGWARFATLEDAASGVDLVRVYREGERPSASPSASTISLSREPSQRLAQLPPALDFITDAAPSERTSDRIAPQWVPVAGRASYRPGFPLAAQRACAAATLVLSIGMVLTFARRRTLRVPAGSRRRLLWALGGVALIGVATVAAIAGLFA